MQAPRPTTPALKNARRGFTLVELLMVILIIAALMALILPAINSARRSTRLAEVKVDMDSLTASIGSFKSDFGVDPPSAIVLFEQPGQWTSSLATSSSSAELQALEKLRVRSYARIKRIWPRFNFGLASGWDIDVDGNVGEADPDGDGLPGVVLNGAECLVFFLAGMRQPGNGVHFGFSKSKTNPFGTTGSGTETRDGPYFEFKDGRLSDLDMNLFSEYIDSIPGQTQPYLYLSSYDGKGYQAEDMLLMNFMAYTKTAALNTPYKAQTFQLISAGFDNQFGTGGELGDEASRETTLVGGRSVERDNVTNFASGELGN